MPIPRNVRWRATIVLGVCALVGVAALLTRMGYLLPSLTAPSHAPVASGTSALGRITLVADDTLSVPDEVRTAMRITVAPVQTAQALQPLRLDGTLFLDTNSMVHVHSRFAGDVVDVGKQVAMPQADGAARDAVATAERPVQFGDQVVKGQVLAVIWSKELGEKKSELVENLSRLRLSQEKLDKLEELAAKGATSERNVREAKREVEADMIGVLRTEGTLRSWRLTEGEISSIRAEAEMVRAHRIWPRGSELAGDWARVEVRAPISGTIVEKNVAVGDFVASDLDLFKIADLTRLDVLAHCYEDDLPILEGLDLRSRRWTITLKADPKAAPLEGRFDRIGSIIDPNQHTALVMGWVDNAAGRLRIGQFVTARVDVPSPPGEVAIPPEALVDLDGRSYVFVMSAEDPRQFSRRRVFPIRQAGGLIVLGCPPQSAGASGHAGECPAECLQPGAAVVSTGAIQLAAELASLNSQSRVKVAGQ
ncbi:MAG: efflux RND transporter periplasmic adaptor subunit [Planctomycetaceae bacterium]